jgi:APA family basic amino acid/polyamine antiporter
MPETQRGAHLNAFDIGCVVVGGIVGVGIFFTPQKVAAAVDGPGQVIAAWSLGGVIALLGALVFAELARSVEGYGGTFLYIKAAFGDLVAFLYGWANWLVIQAGALCVVGMVMVDHLAIVVTGKTGGGAKVWLAAAAIAAFTAVNALGLHVGKRVQNAFTVLKVATLFALVALGLVVGAGEGDAPPAREERSWVTALAAAMLPVLFACGGWQQGSFVAGAARRPAFDVPVGIAAGVVVVVLAYITVNLSFLQLLGFEGVAASPQVSVDATRAALAPFGFADLAGKAVALAITISALGIMNTICLAPPWVLHAMAKQRLFFAAAARLDPRFGSPTLAVLAQGGWALVLLAASHLAFRDRAGAALDFLLSGVVFVDWLFFALCGIALLRLSSRQGSPTFYPGARVAAKLFTLLACAVMVGAIATHPVPSLLGLAVCALGIPVYRRWLRRR